MGLSDETLCAVLFVTGIDDVWLAQLLHQILAGTQMQAYEVYFQRVCLPKLCGDSHFKNIRHFFSTLGTR